MTKLRLLPEAEAELRSAARDVEKRRPGLGRELVHEFRVALARISFLPRASRIERGEIRVQSMARFPYRIYYLVRNDEILVIAMGHRRRRPSYWRNRVEEAAPAYRAMSRAA